MVPPKRPDKASGQCALQLAALQQIHDAVSHSLLRPPKFEEWHRSGTELSCSSNFKTSKMTVGLHMCIHVHPVAHDFQPCEPAIAI